MGVLPSCERPPTMPYSRLPLLLVVCVSSLLALVAAPAGAIVLPAGFTEFAVASGIDHPSAMALAPDGRLFVCEQGGRLRVVKNGVLLPTPFATVPTTLNGDRGLVGVA